MQKTLIAEQIRRIGLVWLIAGLAASSPSLIAQSAPPRQGGNGTAAKPTALPAVPTGYVIGAEDILSVVFWTAKEMSTEALVRPDGKISLPILNDVTAAGLTPEQLAAEIQKAAVRFVRDANVTVIVKAINSRKIYVVGEVSRPGPIALGSEMTVLQAIGEAGGFLEHAKKDSVAIARIENGVEKRYKFNYNDVAKGKKLEQNIKLLPGDMIIVR